MAAEAEAVSGRALRARKESLINMKEVLQLAHLEESPVGLAL